MHKRSVITPPSRKQILHLAHQLDHFSFGIHAAARGAAPLAAGTVATVAAVSAEAERKCRRVVPMRISLLRTMPLFWPLREPGTMKKPSCASC